MDPKIASSAERGVNTTWRFETEFAALNAATDPERIREIRDRAEAQRITAKLAGDADAAALATDIRDRATRKIAGERGHKHGRRRAQFVPLHSFVRDRR